MRAMAVESLLPPLKYIRIAFLIYIYCITNVYQYISEHNRRDRNGEIAFVGTVEQFEHTCLRIAIVIAK